MTLSDHQVQEMVILGLVFFVSLLMALFLTPLFDRAAWRLGLTDSPGGRKSHARCVSRAGGLAMAGALFFTLTLLLKWNSQLGAYWAGAAVIISAGVADDKFRLSSRVKFAAQALAVTAFVYLGGMQLHNLGDILGFGPIEPGWAAPLLTVFAMVGVINAFNMSDGLDGLAAGLAGIACLFFIPFAYAQESWIYLLILTGLFGTLLGFLRYNVHPARLFMGDSGSMFLGFTLAAAAVVLTQGEITGVQEYEPVTALIILSLPIWDTLYVMTRRLVNGNNPFKPDRLHLHHRLMDLGISHNVTVSLVYCLMFFMGISAWLIRPWPEWVQFYSLLGFYSLFYGGLWFWERRTSAPKKTYAPRTGLQEKLQPLMIANFRQRKKIFILIWGGCALPAVMMQGSGPGLLYYVAFILLFTGFYYPWRGGSKHVPIGHGLMFFGIYSLLLVYNAGFAHSAWFEPYMWSLAGLAGLWTLLRVLDTVRLRVLVPGCFEILLLGAAVVSPVLLHYSLGIDEQIRRFLVLSFVQSIPLFLMLKAYLRRDQTPNRRFMLYLMLLFLLVGLV
ncbi:Glycosyl transferase, family 4, conserved region [Desulfonatronospira thiodismutans ASO3-1]|uniref:Glycosyl transferase, family 4, conserved region n=1 Tax=Desulfonatronospira thiodismutans ASO3-1 TaxID=555779 RepID=D6SNA5_9BACT|nr:MraY family glycosyltransferase [Desulfonatronospira thiodismutans]EFI34231.1 Glycosyl transferase, family 4, conserved region [Desulfonatronospira thiodismutans ASO3-1]